jgi:hypothetical protein
MTVQRSTARTFNVDLEGVLSDRTLTGSANLCAVASLDALNMIDRILKSDKAKRRKSITMPHRIVRPQSMKQRAPERRKNRSDER